MDVDRTANLLGATALAVTDRALTGATRAAGVSASGAAALVALSTVSLSVTELSRRVGLSQSAAARMIDSLQADGLVERRRASVGRVVSVVPTRAGRRAAREVLGKRGAPLAELVDCLDEGERRTFDGLLAKLLGRLYGENGDADLICRLCDRPSCTATAVCPVGEAERRTDHAVTEER
jgi:DNA-binding MarR family transcriptional regulator